MSAPVKPMFRDYSYHDTELHDAVGNTCRRWVVIEETIDDYGDVVDTDFVSEHQTEQAASLATEMLRDAARKLAASKG